VAALYVQKGGAYFGLAGVDPWDERRDARLYAGPMPVVAHPPCARWGRLAESAFGRPTGRLGDDGGCFAAALASVRKWGGVLEHPAGSRAFVAHGLFDPPSAGGWVRAGDLIGWTCCVEQGHYGHRTRKATWLYACVPALSLPELIWGESSPPGYQKCAVKGEAFCRLSARQRSATPPSFRDLLLELARRARQT